MQIMQKKFLYRASCMLDKRYMTINLLRSAYMAGNALIPLYAGKGKKPSRLKGPEIPTDLRRDE